MPRNAGDGGKAGGGIVPAGIPPCTNHPAIACYRRVPGGPPNPCAPGQTIYDHITPDELIVASSGVGAPTYGVYVIPIGDLPCNYRMTITADCAWNGFVPPPPRGGAVMHAYLADAGSALPTRDFIPGNVADQLANLSLTIPYDGAYHSYVWSVYPARSPDFADFSGPLVNQSLFIWPPVFFPDFTEGTWKLKNVHVTLVTT